MIIDITIVASVVLLVCGLGIFCIFYYILLGVISFIQPFDYLLTFDLERRLIWPSPWTASKSLFLFTRYLPFIEMGILLYRTFALNPTVQACATAYRASALLTLVGIVVAEVILTLRTLAVWGNNRNIAIALVVLLLGATIPSIPILTHFSSTVIFLNPFIQNSRGCSFIGGSRILSVDWILLMIYDGSMF
ncbi:hypothetical protein BDQ12DRAFT_610379 [Crucibulum laeve]|uniref:DUF6533 domain-containing protein n=1 Tax=Crucibulum laeve TaxID=68775 RepID=A0A5C3LTP0_9AGAR|nr:hypothetical protein BDQ12DRAFT_610379 [Crucibulum laeve]